MRLRRFVIFATGVVASVAVVVLFFTLAWLMNDSAEYAWVGRVLYAVFVVLNPVLPLFQRAVLRLFPAPPGAGRLAIQVAFVAFFLGWWWLVASVVDRILRQRQTTQGAA